MTDVELAVESYLSISLATYLSDIEWLTSFRQPNYMVSLSIRHRLLYRPHIRIMISKRYHNGLFISAPVLKSDFWHRMVDIVFSAELDRIYIIWYRPICRFNIALPLLKRYRNGVISSTHWGRNRMAAISQTTLSNAFSLMKILVFRLKFNWSLFPRVQLTMFQHCFR